MNNTIKINFAQSTTNIKEILKETQNKMFILCLTIKTIKFVFWRKKKHNYTEKKLKKRITGIFKNNFTCLTKNINTCFFV